MCLKGNIILCVSHHSKVKNTAGIDEVSCMQYFLHNFVLSPHVLVNPISWSICILPFPLSPIHSHHSIYCACDVSLFFVVEQLYKHSCVLFFWHEHLIMNVTLPDAKSYTHDQECYKQAGAELCQAQGKLNLFWP